MANTLAITRLISAPTLYLGLLMALCSAPTLAEILYWETVDLSATPAQGTVQTADGVPRPMIHSNWEDDFRSLDGGYTWERISLDGLPADRNIHLLDVDPLDGDTLYAMVDNLSVTIILGNLEDLEGAIWVSRNGGESWNLLRQMSDDPLNSIEKLILDPYRPHVLYWHTTQPSGESVLIERSEDGGISWTPMASIRHDQGAVISSFIPDTWGGVYVEIDDIVHYVHESGLSVLPPAPLNPGEGLYGLTYNPVTDTLFSPVGQRIVSYPAAAGAWEAYPIDPAGQENPEFLYVRRLLAVPGTANALYGRTHRLTGDTTFDTTLYYSPNGGRNWRSIQGNLDKANLGDQQLIVDGEAPALYASSSEGLRRLRLNASNLWWNPATSGQGMVLSQIDNLVWGNWHLYDGNGQPLWLNYQGELVGNRVEADLWQFRGPALGSPWDPAAVQGTVVGRVVLTFDAAVSADFDYSLMGSSGSLAIQPFHPNAVGVQNGVWWEPATIGHGLSVVQVGDLIQGGWYTYDDNGQPRWLVFTGTLENGQLTTDLLGFVGPAVGQPWDPQQIASSAVGTATLTALSATTMTMDYRWNEVSGTLALIPFRR